MIRATFELEPEGSADALAVMESTGMPDPRARAARSERETQRGEARGRVISETGGRAVVEFPERNWGGSVALLVSALVAGEATEAAAFTRCRLVDLELPDGLLPGPALGARPAIEVGVIVKPSLGLVPSEVADVVSAAAAGGARFVKDDELLGDPPWCPLVERVRAVAKVLPAGVVYCANVTGSWTGLLDRARRAVDLGATGIMVNTFAQGVEALLALREAGLGVPILGHRVGSGPLTRNERFGPTGAVLTRLTRLCGADYVIAGGFGGKLFEAPAGVRANLEAIRGPCGSARPAFAILGGGLGPDGVAVQVEEAGGTGLVLLLGSQAYRHPGGIEGAVAAAVAALKA